MMLDGGVAFHGEETVLSYASKILADSLLVLEPRDRRDVTKAQFSEDTQAVFEEIISDP